MTQLKILNQLDQKSFGSPPFFDNISRKKYLSLPVGLQQTLKSLRKPTSKATLILVYGYFKATKRFFGMQFHEKDIRFVAKRLRCDRSQISFKSVPEGVLIRHKKTILKHFGYTEFDQDARKMISEEIRLLVRSQTRPRSIFDTLIEFLVTQKIEIPSYHILSELISRGYNTHRKRMVRAANNSLSHRAKKLMNKLLEADRSNADKLKKYKLSSLKRISHSVSPKEIEQSVEQLNTLHEIFVEIEPIIERLDLSEDGIRYYAQYVLKSPTWRIITKNDDDRYLYIIAFVIYQYFQLQDHLIEIFLSSVRNIRNAAEREHKELHFKNRKKKGASLAKVIEILDQLLDGYTDIDDIAFKKGVISDTKVFLIKDVLQSLETVRDEAEKDVRKHKKLCEDNENDLDLFDILESFSVKLQNRVSGILKNIEFSADCADQPLMKAIHFFQQKDGLIGKRAPTDFLKSFEEGLLYPINGNFRVSLYKVFLFEKVAKAIRADTLHLRYSYRYRTLDDYQISKERWDSNKDKLLTRAGLKGIESPSDLLLRLRDHLDQQYHVTNQRIQYGDNEHVSISAGKRFLVDTPALPEKDSGLSGYFPETKCVSLLEVLATANQVSDYLSELSSTKIKYNRAKPSQRLYFAALMSLGCDIGVKKMAQISTHIDEEELERTVNWHFSLENIEAANNKILSFMDQLELPSVYEKDPKQRHTSSDGQKIEVSVPSVGATYSYKYFGQGKGVTSYSFIDERNFLFHSTVFSSAEREAHYVIDGLMQNDVVESEIHSTDTHGYTEAVFAVTYLLDVMFAPRIKNPKRQQLYTFSNHFRRLYREEEYPIQPDEVINENLITENWDDLLRFVATIKLKEASASQLFRRLNSYSKTNPLWLALKEFGRVVKTLYMLRFVDDLPLRQAIEKQLNKVESTQKFSNAVALGMQQFGHGDREQQCVVAACRRLIKNAVVYWNYLYLSQKIVEAPSDKARREIIQTIRESSIVTWRHINFCGEYDFSDEKLKDSVGLTLSLIRKLRVA